MGAIDKVLQVFLACVLATAIAALSACGNKKSTTREASTEGHAAYGHRAVYVYFWTRGAKGRRVAGPVLVDLSRRTLLPEGALVPQLEVLGPRRFDGGSELVRHQYFRSMGT